MGKVNQYGTSEGIENIKFLGTDENQTVNVPYKTIEERMLEFATATHDKNGLMSKEDKVKLDELGEGSVTGVKGNAETRYRTGNVNLTPANVGAVSKAGDTMTGHLHLGNDTMTNSPNIYWNDKNRSIWAGTANSEGAFYLWDATNGKGIIVSNPGGADNRFLGTASGNLPLTGGKVNGTIQAGDKAWLFTDGEGGTLQILSHDGKYGYHMDGCLDDGIRLYVYQVDPWVYKGEMILDINGGLHASGGFKGTADTALRLKDTNGASYNIGAQYSGELAAADWICAWQDLGNNDIRIRAVKQGNLRVYNATRCGDMAPTSGASGSTIMSRDGNGDTSVRYLNCAYLHSSQGVENYNIAYVVYNNGNDGYYRKCDLSHLGSSLYNNGQLMSRNGGMFTGPVYFWSSSNWTNADSNLWYFKSDRGIQFQPGNASGSDSVSVIGNFIYTNACFQYSARKFKENIVQISEEKSDKILDLEPVEFDYKSSGQHSAGLIADDVEQYYPDLIYYDNDEVTGLNYAGLIPYMLKKIQMQQKDFDALKAENASLAESLAKIQEKLDDITRNTR